MLKLLKPLTVQDIARIAQYHPVCYCAIKKFRKYYTGAAIVDDVSTVPFAYTKEKYKTPDAAKAAIKKEVAECTQSLTD